MRVNDNDVNDDRDVASDDTIAQVGPKSEFILLATNQGLW